MDARPHSEAEYLAIKAATRRALDEAGGIDQALRTTRVGRSALNGYGVAHDASFMPADVIADVEKAAGRPVITEALAALAGYRLEARAECAAEPEDLGRRVALVTASLGHVSASWCEATADGRVTPNEARVLLELILGLKRAVEALERSTATFLAPAAVHADRSAR